MWLFVSQESPTLGCGGTSVQRSYSSYTPKRYESLRCVRRLRKSDLETSVKPRGSLCCIEMLLIAWLSRVSKCYRLTIDSITFSTTSVDVSPPLFMPGYIFSGTLRRFRCAPCEPIGSTPNGQALRNAEERASFEFQLELISDVLSSLVLRNANSILQCDPCDHYAVRIHGIGRAIPSFIRSRIQLTFLNGSKTVLRIHALTRNSHSKGLRLHEQEKDIEASEYQSEYHLEYPSCSVCKDRLGPAACVRLRELNKLQALG
jgi:hypothetical protein